MSDDRQARGLLASLLLAQLAAHVARRPRGEGRLPAARAGLPLHRRASTATASIVTWTIEPGYYLYKKKMGVASDHCRPCSSASRAWPKGEDHTDEYFGTQEIYRGTVDVPVPFTVQPARAREARARAEAAGLRGCRPVLSAADLEDRSRPARGAAKQRAAAARARCSVKKPARPTERRLPAARRSVPLRRRHGAARLGRADLDHRRRLLPL